MMLGGTSLGSIELGGQVSTTAPTITGSLTATIANLTLSSTASASVNGALSSTIGNLSLSSAASILVTGNLTQTIGNLTLSSTATSSAPNYVKPRKHYRGEMIAMQTR